MLLLAAAGWWVDVPYVLAVPVAALLAYWAFARLDLYMGVVLALVPLSINLSELGLTSVGWYMPTEPMLFALLLLSCARWLSGKGWIGRFGNTLSRG